MAPEAALREAAQSLYVAALALGDALGSLIPSLVEVTFAWPDKLCLNGATAGQVFLRAPETCGPDEVPDWMVLGFSLAVGLSDGPKEPGELPNQTTLYEEGCGGITTREILESFGRHALTWINRWQDDGFAPVSQAWLYRAPAPGSEIEVATGSGAISGRFDGLDESGCLLVRVDGEVRTIELLSALAPWPADG